MTPTDKLATINNNYIIPEKYLNNPQQLDVLGLEFGRNLVIAPAGCGKTDILSERVARALAMGIPKEAMAVLTFTNRASREMLTRVTERLGVDVGDGLFIGNIHRYCIGLLYSNHVIPHDTVILDNMETDDILAQLSPEKEQYVLGYNEGNEREQKRKRDALFKMVMRMEHILVQYQLDHTEDVIMKAGMMNEEALAQMCAAVHKQITRPNVLWLAEKACRLVGDNRLPAIIRENAYVLLVAEKYRKYKKSHHYLDYDDVLIQAYDYLLNHGDKVSKKSWVQVDEVQDLNSMQLAIVDLLSTENACILYFGDERQAIFSFIGACPDVLESLKKRCGGPYRLSTNYRSSRYLTEMSNAYAMWQLGTPQEGLSYPSNDEKVKPGEMTIRTAEVCYPCNGMVDQYDLAFRSALSFPSDGGKTAVVVPTNKAADKVSSIFKRNGVKHFNVSGEDVFSTNEVKLLLAHLHAVNNPLGFSGWSRILWKMADLDSLALGREAVDSFKELALLPLDMLWGGDSSFVLNFLSAMEGEVVVFDTETTGLNVFVDEIMQLSAVKLRNGHVVDKFNVFLEGDASRLPLTLKGGRPNPLVKKYAQAVHTSRREAFNEFLSFVGNAPLIGHNAEYDYWILDKNVRRDCGTDGIWAAHRKRYDTLALSKLLLPGEREYSLEKLIESYSLSGNNTHLADDDVNATVSLIALLRDKAAEIAEAQRSYLLASSSINERLRERYEHFYNSAWYALYERPVNPVEPALVTELKRAYTYFRSLGVVQKCDKFEHICRYLSNELLAKAWDMPLKQQLDRYLREIDTLKEEDLCSNNVIPERYIISTVHKAKGMGFENVVITDVTDQSYPSIMNKDALADAEDARKFYVAISRAKKRLCLIRYKKCNNGEAVGDSPLIESIRGFFEES